MKTPLVSVIMPAYNHERYVGEAIESVLNQTFSDFEFIIINDGSTDSTDSVIRGFNEPRIRYYTQENIDAPHTINKGLSLARGKYISIINSDDAYHPERLGYLVETADKYDAHFLFTDIVFIDESSNPINDESNKHVSWMKGLKELYQSTGSMEKTLFSGNIAASSSNFFFNSRVIQEIGTFSTHRYVHDYDFILKTLLKYPDKLKFIADKKYLYYRLHEKNTIRESTLKVRKEVITFLLYKMPEFVKSEEDRAFVESAIKRIDFLNTLIADELNSLQNTLSWKITSPIRKVGRIMIKSGIIKKGR